MIIHAAPSALLSGALGAGTVTLVALAVALAYAHGRYIPLWLPDLGTTGAYTVHWLWEAHVPVLVAGAVAVSFCIALAWGIHRFLMTPFIDSNDTLSPLLIGLGITFVLQGIVSLLGSGLSEHYPYNALQDHFYWPALGASVHAADVAGLGVLVFVALMLRWFLTASHTGLGVKAVMANRDLARSLGMRVQRVDLAVVAIATTLVCGGAVLYANRFDLQPTMMFYPGLTVIAATVTAGLTRPFWAPVVTMMLLAGQSVLGLLPSLAPLQRALPFLVVVVVLVLREARPARRPA